MKTNEFKTAYENLVVNGKDYFEDYLQYCGWFFMNLTDKQTEKIYDLICSFGYPIEEHHNRKWVVFPNGLQFSKDK